MIAKYQKYKSVELGNQLDLDRPTLSICIAMLWGCLEYHRNIMVWFAGIAKQGVPSKDLCFQVWEKGGEVGTGTAAAAVTFQPAGRLQLPLLPRIKLLIHKVFSNRRGFYWQRWLI